MQLDVLDLNKFYYQTRLGQAVQRSLRDQLFQLWGPCKSQTVAGFGFAAPVLRPYLKEARRVICMMPGRQGVMHWPRHGENCSLLTSEYEWPIQTGFIDRMVMLHGLENSDDTDMLVSEAHRALGPGGRIVFIVPNRSGLWSRRDSTPFGAGRPFSHSQLETLLRIQGFMIERHQGALYFPPSEKRYWLKSAHMIEKIGHRSLLSITAGAVVIEASKQVYAPSGGGLAETVRKPLDALGGIAPKPVSGRNLET